jgi:hypothetical protein
LVKNYNSDQFQAIALEVWDGSISQVRSFQQQSTLSFPICLNASSTAGLYSIAHDYIVIVDQDGKIQYSRYGFDQAQIQNTIDGLLIPNKITKQEDLLPSQFKLHPNYPNPFNPETIISFDLPGISQVKFSIFDLSGKVVLQENKGRYPAGHHSFRFLAERMPSGIYYYMLQAGTFKEVKKMTLVR